MLQLQGVQWRIHGEEKPSVRVLTVRSSILVTKKKEEISVKCPSGIDN